MTQNTDWHIFMGNGKTKLTDLPKAPPWRQFDRGNRKTGENFILTPKVISLVNTAIYLRRPLLVTGPPGTGKSSLATAIKENLGLDEVLVWAINSRANIKEALYTYDPIGRLQEVGPGSTATAEEIGRYLRLGPLGTAFAHSKFPEKNTSKKPTVLLIDEIDKSDIDLPNDLLHILEDGYFEIPEVARLQETNRGGGSVKVQSAGDFDKIEVPADGIVRCEEFPIIIITSNGERELPSPFLRRCLQLDIPAPGEDDLVKIALSHLRDLEEEQEKKVRELAKELDQRRQVNQHVATDQLLNAAYLINNEIDIEQILGINPNSDTGRQKLRDILLKTIMYIDHD
ncbi:MAG: MoxR family ATPase [Chloroflexota bacterium]